MSLEPNLPLLLRHEGDSIVCGACGRHWRFPTDDATLENNRDYLLEHVLGHTRLVKKHPPQTFDARHHR